VYCYVFIHNKESGAIPVAVRHFLFAQAKKETSILPLFLIKREGEVKAKPEDLPISIKTF
jgi:hypothetical protein